MFAVSRMVEIGKGENDEAVSVINSFISKLEDQNQRLEKLMDTIQVNLTFFNANDDLREGKSAEKQGEI